MKERLLEARERLDGLTKHTPILNSERLNRRFGKDLYFKCENFQEIGAFKIRGALNAALLADPSEVSHGLCTHSSGNHAQAIAYAADFLGVRSYIVMPENAPKVKIDGVKNLNSDIYFCTPTIEARLSTLQEIQSKTGAYFIPPYDSDEVIFGQSTVAQEITEALPDVEAIITPVGGGGLLSGTSLAVKHLNRNSNVKVYGAEPEGAMDACLSFRAGHIQAAPYIKSMADGLLSPLSERTFAYIWAGVTDIFTCSEDEIKEAMYLIFKELKVVVEPSSAVVLAILLKNSGIIKEHKIAMIITGGNIDVEKYLRV